ncbi:forkhead box protein M1 isoform X2 [Stigmatopora nigra]
MCQTESLPFKKEQSAFLKNIFWSFLTMRNKPRKPLILQKRKLSNQLSKPPESQNASQEDQGSSSATPNLPVGVGILQHPVLPNTQLVAIPKMADLWSVIQALTAKSREGNGQGPDKYIILGGGFKSLSMPETTEDAVFPSGMMEQLASQQGALTDEQLKTVEKDSFFDQNSNCVMQWLKKEGAMPPGIAVDESNKENQTPVNSVHSETKTLNIGNACPKEAAPGKPPFSYMTMIQFALNSSRNVQMTLKEIYEWLQNHFEFFQDENRSGWKNAVRHNLSLHRMFQRKMWPNGKGSYWTIRPEGNRGLTLDRVYTPGLNPVSASFSFNQPTPLAKTNPSAERHVKPLLPQKPFFFFPVQYPLDATASRPSSSPVVPRQTLQTSSTPRKAKCKRKHCTKGDAAHAKLAKMQKRPVRSPARLRSPKTPWRRQEASGSRRKQCLVSRRHEEPLLVCDFGTDTSLDMEKELQGGPRETPVTETSASSSTLSPSRGPSVLDISPIRKPSMPTFTPLLDYATLSPSGVALDDWALPEDIFPTPVLGQVQGGGAANSSLTEGLLLGNMDESLSLMDFSFNQNEKLELGLDDSSLSKILLNLE